MRTLTALMEAQRQRNGVRGVWLVVATLDMFGLADVVRRYASEDYTLGGNDYEGLLVEGGLDVGGQKIAPQGGLSDIGSFNIQIRNEGGESLLADDYVLFNDPVVVYFVYDTGGVADVDRIELVRGVIERAPQEGTVWTLNCRDGSKQDLKLIPQALIDPGVYTTAYSPGAVIPEAFGSLADGPGDGTGAALSLAPCRFYSKVDLTCTAGPHKNTGSTPFQWYSAASRFAEVVTYTESAGVLTVADSARIMLLRPSRAKATNDRSLWGNCADDDLTTTLSVTTGENLDLWLSGCPKLGSLTAVKVVVKATGNYTLTIKDFTTVKYGPTSLAGDQTITLTLADYESDWSLELLNVELDGNSTTVKEIYMQIEFLDFMSLSEEEPQVFQKVTGFKDIAANYMDGSFVDTINTSPRNPAYQIAQLLRGRKLHELLDAKVNQASVDAAAALRDSWHFDFVLSEQVSDTMLDKLGFESGLCIFPVDGAYHIAALDKTREPDHFFYGGYNTIVSGSIENPESWQHDFSLAPADSTQIYNELNIRYAKHPATGQPQRSVVASGQYRISGVCDTFTATTKLTRTSGDDFTDVLVGERVYVSGDITYEVTAVTDANNLQIASVEGGGVSDNSAKNFYLGANIDGACFVSQQAYKNVNALGGNRQRTFLNDGGYVSDFIREDATAILWQSHLKEWFTQPRDRITFSLHHDSVCLQQGDIFLLDHPLLYPAQRGAEVSQIVGSVSSSATTFQLPAGAAASFRNDDWLYLLGGDRDAPEAVQVVSEDLDADTILVVRGALLTPASAHADATILYRMSSAWLCTSVSPMLPGYAPMRVEAEELPQWYFPTGRVVAPGYPLWAAASLTERQASGWGTLRNGRIVDADPDSAISYVGPTTGRYTIT